MNRRTMLFASAAALLTLSATSAFAVPPSPHDAAGAVYTMTNAPAGNEILMFDRDSKGGLTPAGSIATGGLGSGGGLDPLVSQGSLVLTDSGKFLIGVNAGSNDVSVFRVGKDGLELTDRVASGGTFPSSVTVFHDLVYVLNAQGTPNITGFVLDHKGELGALPGSTRALGAGGFAQVGFAPDGDTLIVTARTNNQILAYNVGHNGLPSATAMVSPSSGGGPFGFTFDLRGDLLVAEAGANAVSSYAIRKNGMLDVISASVPNGQAATCWIAGDKKQFFTANPGSQTVSSYSLQGHGVVQLEDGAAGSAPRPLDMGTSATGRFLYALDPGAAKIDAFQIESDGSLIPLPGAPAAIAIYAQGLAVR